MVPKLGVSFYCCVFSFLPNSWCSAATYLTYMMPLFKQSNDEANSETSWNIQFRKKYTLSDWRKATATQSIIYRILPENLQTYIYSAARWSWNSLSISGSLAFFGLDSESSVHLLQAQSERYQAYKHELLHSSLCTVEIVYCATKYKPKYCYQQLVWLRKI